MLSKLIEKYKLKRELKVIREFSKIMDRLNLLVLPIEKEHYNKVANYYNSLMLREFTVKIDMEINRISKNKLKKSIDKPIKNKVKTTKRR